MFKDRREELERLKAELLREEAQETEDWEEDWDAEDLEDTWDGEDTEEDWDEEDDLEQFDEEVSQFYRNYSNRYGRPDGYNADAADVELDDYSEEVRRDGRSETLVLSAIAMALLAGIFAVLAWWAVRFLR